VRVENLDEIGIELDEEGQSTTTVPCEGCGTPVHLYHLKETTKRVMLLVYVIHNRERDGAVYHCRWSGVVAYEVVNFEPAKREEDKP